MTPNDNEASPSLSDQIADRTCRFCNASFTRSALRENHERGCATRSPEQRAKVTQSRDYHRAHYAKAAPTHGERFHGGRKGMRHKKPRRSEENLVDVGFRSPLMMDEPVVRDKPGERTLILHLQVPLKDLPAWISKLTPMFDRIEIKLESK